VAQTKRVKVGKTHVDYWRAKLLKRAYPDRHGRLVEVPEWQVRIAHRGRREFFNLGTANQASASAKARDIYLSLLAAGWDATLTKFKPEMQIRLDVATVGEYLDAARANSGLRAVTFEVYAKKLRTLVAGVFGVKGDKSRFDYVTGGRVAWLAKINRIRLDRLTDGRIETWRVRSLKAAERQGPLHYERAKVTANSILRGAKALFAPDVVRAVKLRLPDPLPLRTVRNVSVERRRYRSTVDPSALLVAAQAELRTTAPEQFKILLLALGVGLRRREIDALEWRHIDFARACITVETTETAAAKSDASQARVDVDPGLLAIFRADMGPGCGRFVIRSEADARPQKGATYHYRANRHFRGLLGWLRAKGVGGMNPIHTLRKEFGSQIAAQAGIFAASVALRHADIQQTRDYYLDKKVVTVFEVSKLLAPDQTAAKGAL
jgi:integrase